MDNENLLTYCGLYGGACARWCGYECFRGMSALLREWLDAQGFQHWMPTESSGFNYDDFRKGLEFFSDSNSWLVCKQCCKGGDGRPDCPVRNCCIERGVEVCFDCDEFPCEKVSDNTEMLERAIEYKMLGKEEWLAQQVDKAEKGFELHTGKYYQMCATRYSLFLHSTRE